MSVTINGIRGASAYNGDLSGSFMAPIVVGIQNIPVSTTLPTDGETLVYNAAQDKYIPGASAGISSVSSSGNITGSGTSLDPIILKDNISLTSVTSSFSGSFVGDGSGLTGIQQDLSGYATLTGVSSSFSTPSQVTSALAPYLTTASAASTYTTTGSNTFLGSQVITGSGRTLSIHSTGSTTSFATSAALRIFQSGSVYGGFVLGMQSNSSYPRLSGLNSSGGTGATFIVQPDGGDILMTNSGNKLIIANGLPSPILTTHKFQVYASNAASGAILIPTGSMTMQSGTLTVTGSIFSSATISGSAMSGAFAGSGTGITGVVSASYATNAGTAQTASYIATASYATNAGTATTLSGFNATNPSVTSLTASNAYISNNLSVAGNLTVNGTMTSVNSTNLEITDKYILIASGAADATALHGAGLQFGTVPSEDARIIYDAVNDEMEIYPAARSAQFRGAFVGDGSGITSLSSSQITNIASYATNAGVTSALVPYLTTASAANTYLAKVDLTASARSAFSAGSNIAISNGQIAVSATPSFTNVTASYLSGSYLGDGSSLTGIPYDVAGEITGSMVSGSELMNYISPRPFIMQALSQYTGAGAAVVIVRKNGAAVSYPTNVSTNDLLTVVSSTTGSKAYFTIKGSL